MSTNNLATDYSLARSNTM